MVHLRQRPIVTRKRKRLMKETEATSGSTSTEDGEYEVELILDHKRIADVDLPHLEVYGSDNLAFLVRWKDYDPSDDTWEPMINLCRTDPFQNYLRKYLIPTIGFMNGVDDDGNDVVSFEFTEPPAYSKPDSCGYYLGEFIEDLMPWKELSACEQETVITSASPAPRKRKRIAGPRRRRFEPLLDDLASISSLPDDDAIYADDVLNGGSARTLGRSKSESFSQKEALKARRNSLDQHFKENFHLLSQSGQADLETNPKADVETIDQAGFDGVSEQNNTDRNNNCLTNGWSEMDSLADEILEIEEITSFRNFNSFTSNVSESLSTMPVNPKSAMPVYHDFLDFMAHFEGF